MKNRAKIDKVEVVRKTKIETTYQYVPILGEVLGFWRKVDDRRIGEDMCVYLNHSLEEYDRLYINGEEISILNILNKK